MNRRFLVSLLTMAMGIAWLATASGAEPIGHVISLQGGAVREDADGAHVRLGLKDAVYEGDTLVTEVGARVQILFRDDTILSVGEQARIVLDEYVYSERAGKDEVRSGMRIVRGVMRIVTGRIAQLNPRRFRVQTRMATIGIRGCDIGIRAGETEEQVYVLHLPPGHSVWVELADPGAGSPSLGIARAGLVAYWRASGHLDERPATASEILRLIQASVPGAETHDSSQTDGNRNGADDDMRASADEQSKQEHSQWLAQAAEEALAAESPPQGTGPTEAPYVAPPTSLPPVLVGGHPEMDDWEWGLWEDGTVQYEPNRYVGGAFIGDDDMTMIASGTTVYDLYGSGMAGAVLKDMLSGTTRTVQGMCTVEILVGNGASPVWGGNFDLNNGDGDQLNFTVNRTVGGGTISSQGVLSLQQLESYSMTVNRRSFDASTLTSQSVEGRLTKPGIGREPVSGATGEFHFRHGSDARVDGAFGATFAP